VRRRSPRTRGKGPVSSKERRRAPDGLVRVSFKLDVCKMAIPSNFTFDYRVTLARLPDGLLGGDAVVDRESGDCPGLLGRRPTVQLRDNAIVLQAHPEDRPRWWMSRDRRVRLASTRRAEFPVGRGFEGFAMQGDELVLSYSITGSKSVVLRRAGRSILGVGGVDALVGFIGSSGFDRVAWPPRGEGPHMLVTVAGEERILRVGECAQAGPVVLKLVQCLAEAFQPQVFFSVARMDSGAGAILDECAREFVQHMSTTEWGSRPTSAARGARSS